MVLPLGQPGWWSVYGPSSRSTWVSQVLPAGQAGWSVGLQPFLQVILGEPGPPCRSTWVIGRFTAFPLGQPGWAGSFFQVNLSDRSVYGSSSRSIWVNWHRVGHRFTSPLSPLSSSLWDCLPLVTLLYFSWSSASDVHKCKHFKSLSATYEFS